MKISVAIITLLSCVILGNGQNYVSFLEPNCGTVNYGANYQPRIIGGEATNILEHPWMVYITSRTLCDPPKYDGSYCLYTCGGSLITTRFVLSAAHCKFNQYTNAKLGGKNGIDYHVEAQIRHPNYNNNYKLNDICLYKLANSVRYSAYARPICLPTNYDFLAETTYLTVAGWGRTEHEDASEVLKKTTLTQLDRSRCSYEFGNQVDMSHICAGAPNSDTCSGDSGGPVSGVYRIGGTNRRIQLGIVSYGAYGCRSVGVYTNVIHFMDWITSVVRQGGFQAPTRRPTYNPPYYNPPYNNHPYKS